MQTMKVSLLKKYILGLIISILLIIINNELIMKTIENIFDNRIINLSDFTKYCFEPIINIITFIGIILTFYFIIKIYIIIFENKK